jgi:hypothetical protein
MASKTAIVKYWRWYSNDKGAWPDADPWIVQVRNEDGPWVDLERTARSHVGWMLIEKDLIELLGPDLGMVQLRFIAWDQDPPSCVEAGIDDFTILADDRIAVNVQATSPGSIWFDIACPNPTKARTVLSFSLPGPLFADLAIYGAGGRLVRRLLQGEIDGGPYQLVWDGLDEGGLPAASGVYFARLEAGNRSLSRRIVLRR